MFRDAIQGPHEVLDLDRFVEVGEERERRTRVGKLGTNDLARLLREPEQHAVHVYRRVDPGARTVNALEQLTREPWTKSFEGHRVDPDGVSDLLQVTQLLVVQSLGQRLGRQPALRKERTRSDFVRVGDLTPELTRTIQSGADLIGEPSIVVSDTDRLTEEEYRRSRSLDHPHCRPSHARRMPDASAQDQSIDDIDVDTTSRTAEQLAAEIVAQLA